MEKPRLAITGDFQIQEFSNLCQKFNVLHVPRPQSYAEIADLIAQSAYYILGGPETLDKRLLRSAKSLKAVAVMGTGTASFIDISAAQELGIAIYNVPQVNAECVAEFAYSVMYLSQAQIFHSIDQLKRKASWLQTPRPRFSQNHIGILGLGACARALIQQLRRNGVKKISYYSRTRDMQFEKEQEVRYLKLGEIAKTCDILSIHISMNESSRHLIGSSFFQQAHPDLKIFNFSNPQIVDPQALKQALTTAQIDFFFIDGYYKEWVDIQNENFGLLEMGPNKFVASSHIAAQETIVVQDVFRQALSSIQSHHTRFTSGF